MKNCLFQLSGIKTAVIMNEFGDTTFDADQLGSLKGYLDEINHGSIFCTCKSELFVESMTKFMSMDVEYLLVESSGFANPSSLDQLIDFAKNRSQNIALETCVVSVVDPVTFPKLLNTLPMLKKQVEVADVVILNKTDLVIEEKINVTENLIRQLNPFASVQRTTYGCVSIDRLVYGDRVSRQRSGTHSKSLTQSALTIRFSDSVNRETFINFLSWLNASVHRVKGNLILDGAAARVEIASGNIEVTDIATADGRLVILYTSGDISGELILKRMRTDFINWSLIARS